MAEEKTRSGEEKKFAIVPGNEEENGQKRMHEFTERVKPACRLGGEG
jgi:hypothetical protein